MAIDCNVVAILDVTIYNYATYIVYQCILSGVIIKLNGRVSIR